jgi:hypothetical protein
MWLRLHALKCAHTDMNPFYAYSWYITRYNNAPPVMLLFIMNSANECCATAAHNEFVSHMLRQSKKELALTLFVLWIFTNNHDASFSLNDFAFFANRFN